MQDIKNKNEDSELLQLEALVSKLDDERLSAQKSHKYRALYYMYLQAALEKRLDKYLESLLNGDSSDEEYFDSLDKYILKTYNSTSIDFESHFHSINDNLYDALIKELKEKILI